MRHHKDWLDAYLDYTSHSEAPDAFHLWTGIATIAGALRRKVHIDMGYFKWHCNFFITFVAPPGVVSKSTTADIGMRLLRQVEGIKMGPSSATWQSLIQVLTQSQESYPLHPGPGPYTPQTEFGVMSALTIAASELGTFLNPEDRQSIDVLVSLWDCPEGAWEKSTKMDGMEHLINPWLQILGCTTPAWIADNMNNYFIGGGFARRTLFIFADVKRRLVAYPHLHIPPNQEQKSKSLVEDLNEIAKITGPYELTKNALEWGEMWYEAEQKGSEAIRLDERLKGYFATKQAHVHKTALIKAAAQRNERVITLEDLQWAARQVTLLEGSMLRVFGQMNREDIVRVQGALMAKIREAGKIKKKDLYAEFILQFGYDTFNAALEGIQGAGLIELQSNGADVFIIVSEYLRKIVADVEHQSPPDPPAPLLRVVE